MITNEKSNEQVDAIEKDAFRAEMNSAASSSLPTDVMQVRREHPLFKRHHPPTYFGNWEENKRLKEEHVLNVRLIEQCSELFPEPATRAAFAQQMVGEDDRVVAFEILLEEHSREIDADGFSVFQIFISLS